MLWSPEALPKAAPRARPTPLRNSPPALLFYSFLGLIIFGTLCLRSDWAATEPVSWLQALFTATSAVTVTGLVVVDTASQFTFAGQLIILLLIQLGGIGLMTFAVVTALIFGFRMGLRQQLLAKEAMNQTSLNTVIKAARSIAVFALTIELLGTVVLSVIWVPELGWSKGIYHGLFYSVSAFNNAGFALSPDGLSAYVAHPGVILAVSSLYIVGGLGYMVVVELLDRRRTVGLSVYTRLILHATIALNVIGTLAFLAFEYDNPHTLGQLAGWDAKLLGAWFQGTVPRTAGFNSLDVSAFTAATSTLFLLLMFIGAAPNSTASGIKITTFVVLLAATRAFLSGRMTVSLYNRTVPNESVIKALAVTVVGMMIVFISILALTITERAPFMDIAFESLSAFGTVGLSRGLTAELSSAGLVILMLVMLVGRVGPLTLGYILTAPKRTHLQYARSEFPVG